ncbi:hypothetical protein HPP92_021624 [Vanilla planifolia]|uniref:USP domain-containing protein n=1 Tax=Vanilla planifolia TaxID=51239 RepID=A0A835UIZ1_VANPL|nr:hypothetical protein HPP92_021624 [Vanilla planifolia]
MLFLFEDDISSQSCQSKHWREEHNKKCTPDTCGTGSRRKFSAISLVPDRGMYKLLKEPKKILFPYDEFVKLFDWCKPACPPCGLLNCGNSAVVSRNVVLQCLACTRPLVAYLLEKDHSRGCLRRREDWCFLCELQIHIKRASSSSQAFSPINILSRLPNIGGNLGYGRQEDAHEFMRFAIDTMQSICLDEYGGERSLDWSTQETTFVHYIFGGHLQSQVTCTKCGVVSNRYENMMDLTVEIHGGAESLEECLDQFTMKEWLDGENMYKCDGCNDYVKACKRLTVHQAPNVLTIALKRFQSGRFGKLNKRVTFPENLDLSPYMSANRDGSDQYTLYGVIVHLDMLNASFFGHYICYTKDYQGQWYKIDDCKVTNVEVEEVLAQGAYMLLYHRRNPRKEAFVKLMEPVSTKRVAETDPEASSSPGASESSSSSFSSVPLNMKSIADVSHPEMLSNVSTLRDAEIDQPTGENLGPSVQNKSENMDLDAPVGVKTGLVSLFPRDLSIDGSLPSSSRVNCVEMEDADPSKNGSSIQPSKACTLEKMCSTEGEANVHMNEGNDSADLSAVQELSFIKKELIKEETSTVRISNSSFKPEFKSPAQNGVSMRVDVSLENKNPKEVSKVGSGTYFKPIFTRGFLDRPAQNQKKATVLEKPSFSHKESRDSLMFGPDAETSNGKALGFNVISKNGGTMSHFSRHGKVECNGVSSYYGNGVKDSVEDLPRLNCEISATGNDDHVFDMDDVLP